jgi:hypothetical protein
MIFAAPGGEGTFGGEFEHVAGGFRVRNLCHSTRLLRAVRMVAVAVAGWQYWGCGGVLNKRWCKYDFCSGGRAWEVQARI